MTSIQRLGTALAVIGLVTLSGCGAAVARAKIVSAESALAAAARADADRKAIYRYTRAQIYLQKALEEEAYGRFGAAISFGGISETDAEKARLESQAAAEVAEGSK